jgi:microcin C transport system substrate-binding protein
MQSFRPFLFASLLLTLVAGGSAWAGLGNDNAPKGGALSLNLSGEPVTLNPLNCSDNYCQVTDGYIIESLAQHRDDTYDWEPSLATSWTTSKDGKEITFKLRPGVTWQDGQPFTAEDVKFSFDVIFGSHYDTAAMRPYLEGIEKVDVIDPLTVKFTTKTKYFGNFESVALLQVVPKHIYQDYEKGPQTNLTVIGTGPYMLSKYEKGKRIILTRNLKWWGWNIDYYKGQNNVDPLILKFVKEDTVALEMLKKGDLDYMDFDADTYTEKAVGPEWGKTVTKVKVENSAPQGFGFVAWNLKSPFFSDRKVRMALWHLMNRKLMIDKFKHGMDLPATGPWPLQSEYASKKAPQIDYDPKKALKLLEAAGWTDADHTGVLSKMIDGNKTPFKFTLMLSNQDQMKYMTLYKEDLKQSGIDMEIKYVEFNSFIKLLDERKFDAVNLGWGAGTVDMDPKQIWHSDSMANKGSNFVSYSNPQVDKLIDQIRGTLDKKKRIPLMRKVYEMIAADAPYAFMFNAKYALYGVTSRVKRPKDTMKYVIGTSYYYIEK